MQGWRFSAEGIRRAPIGFRAGCYALGLGLLVAGYFSVAGWGSAAKLSEAGPQVSYSAGLGPHRIAIVRISHRLTNASADCSHVVTTVASPRVAYAGLVKQHAVIRREPNDRSPAIAQLGRLDVNGLREVLGVIGVHTDTHCASDWYRVQLSILPNGTNGWVRAWAVRTYQVRSRIVVDLSERQLRLYRSGKLVFETSVAVGAAATPTPRGRYFINERYTLPDASGPFGPNALGLSAHSNVLQDVWVENGPIAIHGTNEPWSIGHPASHGCIRVANGLMPRLFRLAPAGTPIIVKT